ncbi:MAG: diguanylate cyclase [Pseudomonadales bacterium]|nr:diguanylate cyclase [Pseudomonadales bacterium]MCP5356909.1 diguanylate cyclase [Pseudomonadales bacterium]
MTNDSQKTLQEEMRQLRQEYHHRLIADLNELAHMASLDDKALSDRDTLKKIHQASHKLAGSALTFGYQETGELLRQFEQTLNELMENGAPVQPGTIRLQLQELTPELSVPTAQQEGHHRDVESPEAAAMSSDAEPLHLYLLEDNPSTSEMLKVGLASFGYRLSPFDDINLLCASALQEQPDALIVGSDQSTFSDEDLSAAMRSIREHGMESIPVFVVSEQDDFENKLQAARNGVVAFLSKPVNIPSLESALDYVLQQKVKSPYRVLLVDDDEFSVQHHKLMLEKRRFVVRTLSDPTQVLDVIEDFHPDLMIFDLHMPTCNGIELAEVVRYHTHWLHIPIIFLSSERSESRQLLAMMNGGDDFIVKPVVEDSFVSTIRSRAQRARQLAELMTRDSLTGLLKHTEIKERLCHELARARRNRSSVTVAMIDIDKFKSVNDTYGHQTGDVVIATLAHLLRRGLRTTDIVGRYGGEEYMVVMPDTSAENAIIKLNALRQEFGTVVFRHHNEEFNCSFSGGVCSSDLAEHVDALVECADQALYAAKDAGRNCLVQGKA